MKQSIKHDPDKISLAQAKHYVETRRDDGVICPCCGQFYKIYKRKLNSRMAATVCWMSRVYTGEWLDVPNTAPRFVLRTNEYGTLRHWGLLERGKIASIRSRGYVWRPTEEGLAFARGQLNVPRYIWLDKNVCVDRSDEVVSVFEALGDHFDYDELMSSK